MEDQLNFQDIEFLENFPNLSNLTSPQSLFDGTGEFFSEFDEIEHLTNFNMELENFNAGSGVKRDVLLSDAMLNRQISYDNGVELKSDVIKIEKKHQIDNFVDKNSELNSIKKVQFVENADEKLLATDSDSRSLSSVAEELEILRRTAHDYEKHLIADDVTMARHSIAPSKGVKIAVHSFDDNEKRKLRQYFGGRDVEKPTDFSNSFIKNDVNVGREITVESRTRRPSVTASPDVNGKSRGAMYAKMYRQKNKNIVDKMQQDLDNLTEENKDLKQTVDEMSGQLINMSQEIRYLRSVLANQSQLSILLKNVASNAPGLKFRFPLDDNSKDEEAIAMETRSSTRKRKAVDNDNDMGGRSKLVKRDNDTSGVCLHVNGDSISLEFCARCAKVATRSESIVTDEDLRRLFLFVHRKSEA